MDPFSKSNESILMIADTKVEGDGGLVIFDLPNKKIKPIDILEINDIKSPGICKLKENIYAVIGGFNESDKSIKKSAYIVDIKARFCIRLADMHDARFAGHCVFYDNKIFVVSGRHTVKDFTYINESEYYDLVSDRWYRMTDYKSDIRGIERVFIENNKLVVVFFKNKMSYYDLKSNAWTDVKEFTYDFDSFYVTNDNSCLVVNNYYNSICKYDYFNDTILFDLFIDDFKGIQHFYIKEIDCIIFTDDSSKSSFVVLDCSTRSVIKFDEQQYSEIFQNYMIFSTTGNYTLTRPKKSTDNNIDILDGKNCFIYGNWNYPFSLIINIEHGDVKYKFYPIPEKLHLKSEQGLTYLKDNEFIFAGGYDDDRSYVHTSDTYAFNPNDSSLQQTEPLVHTVGNIMLRRFNIPKGSNFKKLHNEDDYYIFLVNESDEPEIYLPNAKKWEEVPTYGFTFLPNLLDIEDGAVVFYIKKNPDQGIPNTLVFKVYDLDERQWITTYNKSTDINIYIYFCYRIDLYNYLVINENKDKGIMISNMQLIFGKDGTFEDVKFTELDKIDNKIKGNTVNFFKDGENLVLMYVDAKYKLKVLNFDLVQKKMTKTDRIEKIEETIKSAFDYLRFTKMSAFNTFSVYCANN